MALRAAVFDFDGVIVDSEPLHFRSLRDALMSENVEISHEEYWDHLLAHDDRSSIRLAFERRGERPDPDRLARVERFKVERFAELIPEVPVFPGAREVIGAVGGALLGRTIDTRGDRSVGTLGGALAGGLAGRAVERGGNRSCR